MPETRKHPPIVILVAVSAVGPLALNILMPSMPRLPAAFGTDYGTVQLTLSLYLVGLAVSQLAYGPLSDRFGRRPLLLGGLGLFLLGTLAGSLAVNIEMLIVGRVIQAIGGSAGLVLARAIVRDLCDRERSASVIGYITAAMVTAPMVAPLVGGYLDGWLGWRSSFWLVGGVGAIVTLFAVSLLHESNHDLQPLPGLRGLVAGYRELLRLPVFRSYALFMTFISAGYFAFLGGAPYVIVELMGRPPSEYGWYFAVSALGYMFGNLVSGRASMRLGIERMIGLGVACSLTAALIMPALALAGAMIPIALFGPMVLFAVGNGLALPNGMAGAISANPRRAGAASGLIGFLQMSVGAGVSTLVGHLVSDSQLPLTVIIAVSTVIASLSYGLVLRTNRHAALQPAPVASAAG